MYLLDSSVIIEILAASQKGMEVRDLVKGNPVATTSIVYMEVMSGVSRKIETVADQFFASLTVLEFTLKDAREAVQIEKELQKRGRPIERMDVLIAGTCKSQNAVFVTCDKGFRHIPGLEVEVIE